MSTLESVTMARLMATSCWIAIEWLLRGERVSIRSPRLSRWRAASRWVAFQSMPSPRRTSWPSMTFSPTVRLVQRLTSWYTVLIPASWAWRTVANRRD